MTWLGFVSPLKTLINEIFEFQVCTSERYFTKPVFNAALFVSTFLQFGVLLNSERRRCFEVIITE